MFVALLRDLRGDPDLLSVDAVDVIGLIVIGFAAGMASGLLGIGGGVLFVPGLVIFLDESQLHALSTSLVAVVIVSVVGTWRQREYGNVRLRRA